MSAIIEARPLNEPSPSRGGWRRFFGYALFVWFAFMLLVCGMMVFQPTNPDDRTYGFVLLPLMVLLFGLPAWALVRSGRRARADAERLDRLRGVVHTRGWIPLASVARSLGLSEPAAQDFVDRAIARWGVRLTYFPEHHRYLSASDAERLITLPAQRCPSCDAPSTARQLLPGDSVGCDYCGTPLRVSA